MSAAGDYERARSALTFIPPDDRDLWIRIGMALKSELGDPGFDLWDAWSRQADSYNERDARDVWRSCKANGGVTAGTLFHEAKARGWRDDGTHRKPTPEELEARRAEAAERIEKEQEKERAQHEAAAASAVEILAAATGDPAAHPYAINKRVPFGPLVRRGLWPQRGWTDALLVPIYGGDGHVCSVEAINADGDKDFLAGGKMGGGFHPFGKIRGADRVLIGEGLASVAVCVAAEPSPAAAALSASNLKAVALAVREMAPETDIILVADNDVKPDGGNPGLKAAKEAAAAVGARVVVPEIDGRKCDVWDLWAERGIEAVQRAIEQWPDPQPIDREAAKPEPYPLDALPETIGKAVREYQAYGQQPAALVASSALAVVSLAAQGLADVARDDRLRGPLSLNFLIIAKSGERKTAADRTLGATLTDWERERADALRDAMKINRAVLEAWTAEQEGIKAAIKDAVRRKPEEVDKLKERLIKHSSAKPAEIIAPRLRYEDVNPQSLAFMLAAGHPSAALWSDEGGMVTGSHGMGKDSLLGFMAGLNRLWDGGAIHHDRKQAQSVHLEGRRLTVSLMVQPLVLRELAQRGGGLTRGNGFLARYLVAAPLLTMGARPYKEAPPGMPHLAAFHRRIRELLDSPLPLDDQRRLSLPVFPLSKEAFVVWRDYHDAIERELRPLGEYVTVCDFAAKSAENAARLAGCIHVFEGAQGAISNTTMDQAATLARWYLREALRVLDVLDEPQAWVDARLLDAWLAEAGETSTRDVSGSAPARCVTGSAGTRR